MLDPGSLLAGALDAGALDSGVVDSGVVDSGTDVSGGVVVVRAEVVNVGICSSVDGVVVLSLSVSAGLPPGSSTPPVGSVDGGLVDGGLSTRHPRCRPGARWSSSIGRSS